MSRAKLLAKLCAKSLQITGQGFGGTGPEISALDVAGALGMSHISRPAYLYGLAKYAGDTGAAGRLWVHVHAIVVDLDKRNRWNLTGIQAQGLCSLAIREHMHQPHCPKCNGSGLIGIESCEHCLGSGLSAMSARVRSLIVGVPKSSWHRNKWDEKANKVWAEMASWENEVISALNKHFSPEAA